MMDQELEYRQSDFWAQSLILCAFQEVPLWESSILEIFVYLLQLTMS